ncbi:MAG: VOC family protein [Myxococcota bacterium]
MDRATGTWRPGAVVWREAATTDLERTTAFYSGLFGWTHHDSPGGMGVYRHFEAGGVSVAGGWQIPPSMAGVPTSWTCYISVPDPDAAAAAATAHGGRIVMGPMDIPDVGRSVIVADPTGAVVSLFRDAKGDMPASAGFPPPGTFCWETLTTTDKAAAIAFYQAVVGFKTQDFHGHVTLNASDAPMSGVADVGDAPPGVPSHWMSHVVVTDLAASRDRAAALGGTVLMPAIAIPETGTMAVIRDPLGAVISLFEPLPRA